MKVRRIHIAVVLAPGFDASVALAQAVPAASTSIADGTSNTLLISKLPRQSPGTTPVGVPVPNQAPDLAGSGSATVNGTLSGRVIQSADSFGTPGTAQLVATGEAASSRGNQIVTNGVVGGAITKIQPRASGISRQQRVASGSIDDSSLGTATTGGVVTAAVNQTNNPNGAQSVEVSSVRSTNKLASLTTPGTAGGEITQSIDGRNATQGIGIGSVVRASGNRVVTEAFVSDRLAQVANRATGDGVRQNVLVGKARDSQLGTASTGASASGDITQQMIGRRPGSTRTFSVDSIDGSQAGVASTVASVTERIDQTASDAGFSGVQRVSIGGVDGARGVNLVTKAVISGNISQDTGNSSGSRTVSVASVLGRR